MFSRTNMRTGSTSFSVLVICLWLLMSGALAVDNMEGNETASVKHIRQSQCLCAGEQAYIQKRKEVALKSLHSLGINCTADLVPHITLLASGGGQRAAVGLVGFLYQMEKEGLLDTLLYLGGVSGSTWSMSFLYSDPQWSTNMDQAVSRLSGPGVVLNTALTWLGERAKEEHFSLTDIWGVLTSAGIMNQMDLRHLSDEASRDATNPYPVYCAIEMHCFSDGPTEGKWFEVSPHEAGFTELGLFLNTSLLGSKFQNGELLEEKPEMDMVKLQGVLGCALAHAQTIKEFIPSWLNVPDHVDDAADGYLRVYIILDKVVALIKSTIQDPIAISDLDKLQKTLEDMANHNESVWMHSNSSEERKRLSHQWGLELLAAVDSWGENLEEGPFKTHVNVLTKQVLPLILNWEWGTTSNFLYQYQDSPVPTCLSSKESFHLVDAGLLINVAYPSFLGDKRDIDLIIAPEYSAGNIFETLTLTRDYAAATNKPFPEIEEKILEEKHWPKDCYVFEGKGKEPTIIYMPLFNRRNCKDAEEIKAKMLEFSTFQRPFSQEKTEFVLETARANMKNNKDTLLREIHKAVLRRQHKSTSVPQRSTDSCAGN
ncbi:cytosolic phospholipase A2 gamma-like [Pempheris klunzingeri]|uniref:cytosolic phospholipase A2 gamma-like n=1 Tax=Pempheris klunzingeri TaxID=3127111 RepID=UPI003980D49A